MSINSTLYVSGKSILDDVSIKLNLNTLTCQANELTINSSLYISGTCIINNQVTLNSTLVVSGTTILNDTSILSNLYISNDSIYKKIKDSLISYELIGNINDILFAI